LCGQSNENELLLQTATLDMTSGTDMITRQLHMQTGAAAKKSPRAEA
jgi:hypothetical protein